VRRRGIESENNYHIIITRYIVDINLLEPRGISISNPAVLIAEKNRIT